MEFDDSMGILLSIQEKFKDSIESYKKSLENIELNKDVIDELEDIMLIENILEGPPDVDQQDLEAIRIKLEKKFPDNSVAVHKYEAESDSDIEFIDEVKTAQDPEPVIKNQLKNETGLNQPNDIKVENNVNEPAEHGSYSDDDDDVQFIDEVKPSLDSIATPVHDPPVIEVANLEENVIKNEQSDNEPDSTTTQHEDSLHIMDTSQDNIKEEPSELVDDHEEPQHQLRIAEVFHHPAEAPKKEFPRMMDKLIEIAYLRANWTPGMIENISMEQIFEEMLESQNHNEFYSPPASPLVAPYSVPFKPHEEGWPLYGESSTMHLAKKTTKPIPEIPKVVEPKKSNLFGGRHETTYDPRKDVVHLGRSRQLNYMQQYLKVPIDTTADNATSDSESLTPDENDLTRKQEMFQSHEETRKKIIADASEIKESSPPPPEFELQNVNKKKESQVELAPPYKDDENQMHMKCLKVLKLEYDPNAKSYYADYLQRHALNIQIVKEEPVEYAPQQGRRRVTIDDEEEKQLPPIKHVWVPEDVEHESLLQEIPFEETKTKKKGRGGKTQTQAPRRGPSRRGRPK